jgi:hypothetical protein
VLLNRPSFCLTHLMSEYCSRSHTPSSLDRTKNALMGSKKVYDSVPMRKAMTGRAIRGWPLIQSRMAWALRGRS